MNTIDMRDRQLNIRLSGEEDERLVRIATHYGLNAAGVIRMLLKREDEALTIAQIAAAPFALNDNTLQLLRVIDDCARQRAAKAAAGKDVRPVDFKMLEPQWPVGYGEWLRLSLKRLEVHGYIEHFTHLGYMMAPRGGAALAEASPGATASPDPARKPAKKR